MLQDQIVPEWWVNTRRAQGIFSSLFIELQQQIYVIIKVKASQKMHFFFF